MWYLVEIGKTSSELKILPSTLKEVRIMLLNIAINFIYHL